MPPTATETRHRWCLSAPTYGIAPESVDTAKGILRGVAICTEGEAAGHGYMLDEEFITDVVTQGNAKKSGLKVRFGHPNMSSTALGTFLGRAKSFRLDRVGGAAVARADVYLSNEAKETPHGNLHDYAVRMAANEPDMCGMSIVFVPGEDYQKAGPDGKVDADSPWYASLDRLLAADMVDDPAANPDGMFSAWSAATFAGQVTEFLDTHPEIWTLLEAHPEVVEQFMARYRAYLRRKDKPMSKPNALTAAEIADDAQADDVAPAPRPEASGQAEPEVAEPTADEADDEPTPDAEPVAPDAAEPVEDKTESVDEAPAAEPVEAAEAETTTEELDVPEVETAVAKLSAPYVEKYGQQGAVWFCQGKSLAECAELHAAALEAENAELRKKLGASRGEDEPVSFLGEGQKVDPRAQKLRQNLGENLAAFASSIKLPVGPVNERH